MMSLYKQYCTFHSKSKRNQIKNAQFAYCRTKGLQYSSASDLKLHSVYSRVVHSLQRTPYVDISPRCLEGCEGNYPIIYRIGRFPFKSCPNSPNHSYFYYAYCFNIEISLFIVCSSVQAWTASSSESGKVADYAGIRLNFTRSKCAEFQSPHERKAHRRRHSR